MTKHQLDVLSLICDTVAFFLITLDLYGKERLELINKRLKNLKPDNAKQYFNYKISGFDVFESITGNAIAFIFIVFFGILLYCQYNWDLDDINKIPIYKNFVNEVFINIIINMVIELIGFFLGSYFILLVLRSLSIFLYFIFVVIVFIFKRKSLEGLMLISGATIYLIGKYMSYYNLNH